MKKQKHYFWSVFTFILFLGWLPLANAQCPDPVIEQDPDIACTGPVVLKVEPAGQFIGYQWSTGSTDATISVTTSGTYSVTVKCTDGTIKTVIRFVKVPVRIATLIPSLVRKCLPEDPAVLTINLAGSPAFPGPYEFKIVSLPGNDTITYTYDSPPFTFTVNPSITTSYRLISAKSLSGCDFLIGTPNKSIVENVFEDESQFPTIDGDLILCEGENTTVNLITPLDPLSMFWIINGSNIPSLNNSFTFFEPGSFFANAVYSPQCTTSVNFVIEEVDPVPEVVTAPVCSGNSALIGTTEVFTDYQWSNGDTGPQATVFESGFYTVTITDINGCTGTDSAFVPEYQQPNVSINGPIGLCSTQSFANLVANGFNIQSYTWSTGDNSPNITINGAGSYTVTVVDNQGCTNEETQIVEDIPTPTATMTPTFLCEGSSLVLSPVTSSPELAYQWSNGATTASITVTAGGLYRVTVSDPTLTCSTSTFSLVTLVQRPLVDIQTASSNICDGKTATLTAVGNATSYSWSTGVAGNTINTAVAGTYTVTATGTNGCTRTDVQSIAVLPTPIPQISGPRSLCGSDSVLLSVGNYPIRQWSTGDTTAAIWVKNIGTYSVQVTNSFGCTGTTLINVVSSSPGQVAVAGPVSLCNTDSITLVASGPFASFAWSNGTQNDSVIVKNGGAYTVVATDNLGCTSSKTINVGNGGNFATNIAFNALCNRFIQLTADPGYTNYAWSNGANVPFTQTGTLGNYTVTVTNGEGCTSSTTYNVTVLPQEPAINVVSPAGLCPGSSGTITLNNSFPTIAWSNGSNATSIPVNQSGSYTVTVTDEYGCTSSRILTVAAYPEPQPDIAGSLTICNGGTTNLNVVGTFSTVQWSTGSLNTQITVSTPGTYTVTVSNANACTGTAVVNIEASSALSPNIAVEPYECDNQLTLNAGGSFNTYSWSTGASSTSISVTAAGDYGLIVTDADGCIGTAIYTVSAIPTTPPLSIQGTSGFCTNIGTDLVASAGFNAYLWNNGSNSAAINISNSGTYTVTATDANGCTTSTAVVMTAVASPVPAVTIEPYLCDGVFVLNGGNNYMSYEWSTGSNTPTTSINAGGVYTVTVTNTEGCTGTDELFVASVPVRPTVELNGDNRICPGGQGAIQANTGFTNYAWSTGATSENIVVTAGGEYTVTVTDNEGCTASASFLVETLDTPQPVIATNAYQCDGNMTFEVNAGFVSYNWSNGSNNTVQTVNTSGIYTVTVTDVEGCTGTAVQEITIPNAPVTQITQSPGVGTSVELTADAGFQTYFWSNGSQTQNTSVSSSGIYTVTVVDANNCTATASTQVTIIVPPLVVSAVQVGITCFGANNGQLVLCINDGQPPYTIVSSPSVPFQTSSNNECDQVVSYTDIPAGGFNWSVTDANGTVLSNLAIFTNPPALSVAADVSLSTITASANGGTPGYTYSIDGTNYQPSPVFDSLPNGTYTVYAQDLQGCVATVGNIVVFVSGTNDPTEHWSVQILPNPSNGQFQLALSNCGSDQVRLQIWDITGRILQQHQIATGDCSNVRYPVDMKNQPAGSYLIQIQTDHASLTLPVVIVR